MILEFERIAINRLGPYGRCPCGLRHPRRWSRWRCGDGIVGAASGPCGIAWTIRRSSCSGISASSSRLMASMRWLRSAANSLDSSWKGCRPITACAPRVAERSGWCRAPARSHRAGRPSRRQAVRAPRVEPYHIWYPIWEGRTPAGWVSGPVTGPCRARRLGLRLRSGPAWARLGRTSVPGRRLRKAARSPAPSPPPRTGGPGRRACRGRRW